MTSSHPLTPVAEAGRSPVLNRQDASPTTSQSSNPENRKKGAICGCAFTVKELPRIAGNL